MRRLVKVLLALAVVAAVSQTPFAYRRYQLGQLDATIRQLNASRSVADDAGFADYRGVLHVHSFLGGHSAGRFEEIVAGARSNALAFVVMSEHPSPHFDTRALTLSGTHDGVLFLPGSETSEDERDRLLTFGDGQRQLVFVAHPETFTAWQSAENFDGMEVYNLHADAANARPLTLFFDGLWSYRAYPHLLWTRFHEAPTENLRRWDELTARGRRTVAVAGNDAHANVGLGLRQLTGEPVFEIKLDPYERSFRVVRNHVLLERVQPLAADTLVAALRHGRSYIAFDIFGDSTGFRFTAHGPLETKTMGDEIALPAGGEVRLKVRTPAAGRVVFFRDGQVIREFEEGTDAELAVGERGVYRVEIYLAGLRDFLGERKPWIISNPIYVR